jgi:hypothetical protein
MPSDPTIDVFSSLLTVVGSLIAVIVCIGIGWVLIWKCFLSRFEFIREIVNSGAEERKEAKTNKGEEDEVKPRRSSRKVH